MGFIAFDPLCARIPRCHFSRRGKQEYSVVSYLVYEETKDRFVIEVVPTAFNCRHGLQMIVQTNRGWQFRIKDGAFASDGPDAGTFRRTSIVLLCHHALISTNGVVPGWSATRNLAQEGMRLSRVSVSARAGRGEAGNVRPCSSFLCHLPREKEFECRR
jgi:hypothetical protein